MSGLAVLAGAAVIALGAGAGTQIPPASTTWNVMPIDYATGGQSTDCSVFGSTASNQFRIDNPQTGSYSTTALDGTPVTFALTVVANGQKKDKYFDWQATGASVFDVGVKGGMDTARYAYTTPIPNWSGATNGLGAVFSDTGVHATLDNQSKLYNLSNVTFCYGTGAAVSGTVFDDANNNGAKNAGEGGIQGRTVRLYSGSSATPAATATTNAAGGYSFSATQITVGSSFRVCLVAAPGRTQTLPTSSTSNKATCDPTTPGPNERALGYGGSNLNESMSGLDFGEAPVVALSGTVFSDANDNGQKNVGESGLGGRTVRLYAAGSFAASQATDASGGYSFVNRTVGVAYRVCLVAASGYAQTLPTAATTDSAACTTLDPPNERARGYGFTPTADRTGLDFGEVALVTISGAVFDDANDSGSRNTGESGIAGRMVRLYSGASSVSAQTDANGVYTFADKPAGVGYRVCLVGVVGRAQTLPTAATTDQVSCTGTGERAVGYGFTPTATRSGLDFGEVPTRTLDPTCRLTVGSPPSYVVQFATCKENDFVVAYSDEAGNKFASVRPVDTTKPKIPVIERITWTFTGHIQQPLKIRYDDTLPYGDVPRDMLFCRLDPRDGTEFGFNGQSDTYAEGVANVLPAGETSCLIMKTETAVDDNGGKVTYYVYSALDGWREIT